MDSFASGFAGVDAAGDANSFVTYLDLIHSMPFFRECKRRSFVEMGIRPGAAVLEIGCGNGVDATILAGMVGAGGNVIGIDVSRTMLASAQGRTTGGHPSPGYAMSDAAHLPFADASFDAVRTDRVLQHTTDIFAVTKEMARVTRPAGKVVAFEPDWETFVLWPGEREATRKILNFWCDHIPNGWAGRTLPAAFHDAGLEGVAVTPSCLVITDLALAKKVFDLDTTLSLSVRAGILDSREAESWAREQAQAAAAGRFFSSLTFYLVTGTRRA
ncbi:methyltransferase domain-containing protein [Methanoregula sp. UBA64]|jgi:ubiquinone/menaquinone biosynthesis C-methylase UbiE|uniref:methyltransferase domain-containing protein n=1 Tax=Methanoregula sp. UBA64 TaxID=1915554 RepID=UPI0025FBA7D3|nr:methyltransferase domain-containing protein [Methanoregula sp. UBA64]